jgi:hypothetical protein
MHRHYAAKVTILILAGGLGNVTGGLSAQTGATRPFSSEPATWASDYQPPGDYYDWRKTGQPERPWFHKYDQSLVMKIFLAERTDAGQVCKVHLTFEQALKVIERLDRITCELRRLFIWWGGNSTGTTPSTQPGAKSISV